MYPTILDRIRYPTKMHIMGLSIILSMLLLNTKPGIGLNPTPHQARPIVFYRPGNATEGVPNPQLRTLRFSPHYCSAGNSKAPDMTLCILNQSLIFTTYEMKPRQVKMYQQL